jgi:dipeptidase
LFDEQRDIEKEAMNLFEEDPQNARLFLTDYTNNKMNEILKLYTDLRYTLIEKYSNNVLEY